MNNLLFAYIFLIFGLIPYAFFIHEFYNYPRIMRGKCIKNGLMWQNIGNVIQIIFGVISIFLQLNYCFGWV